MHCQSSRSWPRTGRLLSLATLLVGANRLLSITALLGGLGCREGELAGQQGTALGQAPQLLAWGRQPDQVLLRSPGLETVALGPSALALDRDGSILVLDRLNRRVLRLAASGSTVAARVPEDAEALALGPGGSLAVYSPLRARVWFFVEGNPAGELALPRELGPISAISLGPSLRLRLQNPHQESYQAGSPSLPQSLGAILRSQREGADFLSDGTGVAVRRRDDGRPELLLHRAGERISAARRLSLDEVVLAAQIVGTSGELICLRLELPAATPAAALRIRRRAVCLDQSGQRLLSVDLPDPGLYLPAQELAVGADPPRLAMMQPQPEGLRLLVWPLPERSRP